MTSSVASISISFSISVGVMIPTCTHNLTTYYIYFH